MKVGLVQNNSNIAMKGIKEPKIIKKSVRQLKANMADKPLCGKVDAVDRFYEKAQSKLQSNANLTLGNVLSTALCASVYACLKPFPDALFGALISLGGVFGFGTSALFWLAKCVQQKAGKKYAQNIIKDYIDNNKEFMDTINEHLKKTGNPEITAEDAKNEFNTKDIMALYLRASENN